MDALFINLMESNDNSLRLIVFVCVGQSQITRTLARTSDGIKWQFVVFDSVCACDCLDFWTVRFIFVGARNLYYKCRWWWRYSLECAYVFLQILCLMALFAMCFRYSTNIRIYICCVGFISSVFVMFVFFWGSPAGVSTMVFTLHAMSVASSASACIIVRIRPVVLFQRAHGMLSCVEHLGGSWLELSLSLHCAVVARVVSAVPLLLPVWPVLADTAGVLDLPSLHVIFVVLGSIWTSFVLTVR